MARPRQFPTPVRSPPAPGGFVGLVGGTASNAGTISAPLGKIGIGSGEQATLDLNGDGFLQVAIPTNAAANGQPLIDVSGKVKAAGGRIEIKAATAQQAVRNAVNISGTLSASSARRVGGEIILDGGEGGQVDISGKIAATSKQAKGGTVQVGGQSIALHGARINVSGAMGGGRVTIGGGSRGAAVPGLTTAQTVSIDATSSIKANARKSGDGGQVTIWGDALTEFRRFDLGAGYGLHRQWRRRRSVRRRPELSGNDQPAFGARRNRNPAARPLERDDINRRRRRLFELGGHRHRIERQRDDAAKRARHRQCHDFDRVDRI